MPDPAVQFQHVTFAYPGAAQALADVTLDVATGACLGVLGPNGGGKSTLLKLALGLLNPTRGVVRVLGHSPREAAARGLIGYVPQRSGAEQAFPLSVRQVVEMGPALRLSPWRTLTQGDHQAVDAALAAVGATSIASKHVGSLSGGQFQRVQIARALASRPKLLLLDEPTVGIDVAGQQQFADLLNRLRHDFGITVMVVSHDIRTVASGCDRIACLSRTLHSHVAPEGLTPGVLAEVFRHDVAAIFGDLHVDAHSAEACTGHHHAPATPVQISIPSKPTQGASPP
ncbi:MAG: ATP-binding cassette domain-containing protein [Tepidisphaera sp.]|nr:ATP-binding cassette domain-containing protein [Tepidisphaera sp.]